MTWRGRMYVRPSIRQFVMKMYQEQPAEPRSVNIDIRTQVDKVRAPIYKQIVIVLALVLQGEIFGDSLFCNYYVRA